MCACACACCVLKRVCRKLHLSTVDASHSILTAVIMTGKHWRLLMIRRPCTLPCSAYVRVRVRVSEIGQVASMFNCLRLAHVAWLTNLSVGREKQGRRKCRDFVRAVLG